MLVATIATLGLLRLIPGASDQLKVHELRSADTKHVCDLRTAVFSPELERPYTKILQGRKWEESMREKDKVLVARATAELAAELRQKDDFVGYAGDDDEPIIGTADMKLVLIPQEDGSSCCYVNNVCVDPCARKRSVARTIMQVVDVLSERELGASAVALHVDADNIPAIRLYESIGFVDMPPGSMAEVLSSEPFVAGDEGEQRLMMKPLNVPNGQPSPAPPLQETARNIHARGGRGVVRPSSVATALPEPRSDPSSVGKLQESILAMNRLQQIADLEDLIKSLTLTSGATPEELSKLQSGLDRMRASSLATGAEQEVVKQAWLSVVDEQGVATSGVAADPALPRPTPYLDTFSVGGKGASPQAFAKAKWMSRLATERDLSGPGPAPIARNGVDVGAALGIADRGGPQPAAYEGWQERTRSGTVRPFAFRRTERASAEYGREDPRCDAWAREGECKCNPGFMMEACAAACAREAEAAKIRSRSAQHPPRQPSQSMAMRPRQPAQSMVPPTPQPSQSTVPPPRQPSQSMVPPTPQPAQSMVPPPWQPSQSMVPPTPQPAQSTVPPTPQPSQSMVPPTPQPAQQPPPTTNAPVSLQNSVESAAAAAAELDDDDCDVNPFL
jgi:ribosomal protein S18 acetylase RimI-like enzyme